MRARLDDTDLTDLPAHVALLLADLPPDPVFRTLSHASTTIGPMLEFARSLCTSLQLPARLRELAILALAGETNATFVWTQHVPISAREGIGEDLTDAERSVLRFTAAVANGATVPDDVFTEIRAQLSAREIVELLQVLVLGYYAMLGRISTVLDIEPSELYDGYRDSFLD